MKHYRMISTQLIVALYRKTAVLPLLLLIGLFASATVWAQGNTASLNGIVHDSTGAAVQGADVTVTNKASGDVRHAKTNGSGLFNFAGLQSGDFDVKVTKQNFRAVEQQDIHLDPGDVRAVPTIQLVPGEVAETVTVSSTQNGVEVDSGEVSSTISSADIENLAVEGRDVTELLKILPGMAISNGAQYTVSDNRAQDPGTVSFGGGLGGYAANGTFKNGTALLIDGADITDPGSWGTAIQTVNYDMVAEVKVSTGSFGADTARGPVVINAVSKSGTDKYHGSLYIYARTYQLNSIDFLVKAYGQGKPADRFLYPGFTFGGPVRFPFTSWNHNNKLTFFVGAEDYVQRNVYAYNNVNYALVRALVPTLGMRQGHFNQTELTNYLGDQYVSGGTNCSINYPQLCMAPTVAPNGSAIVNGDISAYLDPLSQRIMNLFPLPNQPSVGGFNYIAGNYVNNNFWQVRSRIDYGISDREKLFISYGYEAGTAYPTQGSGIFSTGSMGGLPYPSTPGRPGGQIQPGTSHVLSIGLNSVLSNTLTNELYLAGAYFEQPTSVRNPGPILGNPYQFFFNNTGGVLPALTDSGHNGLPELPIQDVSYGRLFSNKQIRSGGDNVTKLWGKHVFRTGIFYQWDDNPAYSSGVYTNGSFSPSPTNSTFTDPIAMNGSGAGGTVIHLTGSGSNPNTGNNYLGDFAEGIINSFSQANLQAEANLYFWNLSGYVQDHWRILPRLSIDAGVRFEHFTPWQDASGIGISVFSASAYAANFPTSSPGIVNHSNTPSIPNSGVPTATVYVEPRGGFSYDIYGDGKTILRGGAGLYRQHDAYSDLTTPAIASRGQRTYSTAGGGAQFSTLHQYQGNAALAGGNFVQDTSVHTVDSTDSKVPTVLTYNAAVDQFMPHGQFIEVSYVGNQSTNLLNNQQSGILANINTIPIGGLYTPYPATRPDITTGPAPGYMFPFFAISGATSKTPSMQNITTAEVDAYRPFPRYAQIYAQKHVLSANYNSLQARYRLQGKRAALNANYTWGKALGNYWGTDPMNYSNGYMPLISDRRHILNITGHYHVGSVLQNKWLGGIINNWAVAGIVGYQTGINLPSIYSYNYNATNALSIVVPQGTTATTNGLTSSCASSTCSVGPTSQKMLGTPDYQFLLRYTGNPQGNKKYQYVNPDVLELPGLLQPGPLKVPVARGPSFFNTDLNATKNFPIHGTQNIMLRIAAFNFLNRANPTFSSLNPANYTMNYTYTAPAPGDLNAILATPRNTQTQFGTTTLANGMAQKAGRRVLEVALKYSF